MTHDNGEWNSAEVPGNGSSHADTPKPASNRHIERIGALLDEFGAHCQNEEDRPARETAWAHADRLAHLLHDLEAVAEKHLPRSAETGQAKVETAKHTLDQALEAANVWARDTFPTETTAGVVKHLQKEVAELAAHPGDWTEMADVLILLARLADRAGVNLGEAVMAKLAILRTREWGEPDADGVVEHVR